MKTLLRNESQARKNSKLIESMLGGASIPRRAIKQDVTASAYYHSGNLGDIVYALFAIKKAGGGKLLIGPEQRGTATCSNPITRAQFELLKPLIDCQGWITSEYCFRYPIDTPAFDLNSFRNHWDNWPLRVSVNVHTLAEMHFYTLGIMQLFRPDEPWLKVDAIKSDKVVIHRSERYNGKSFPWKEIVKKHSDKLLFVGLKHEHERFESMFGRVEYKKVSDFLELAGVISGARGFIGNQSFPCSLAIATGQNVMQEVWNPSPDCVFNRKNFFTANSLPEFETLCLY